MTNAMPNWSWRGYEGKTAHVEVYARAASVELFVNGASKGKTQLKNDCLFTFKVPYENGTIEAVSYDESGKEIGRNRLVSAKSETVLQAVPEASAIKAGHLAFIRLKYTDKNGETKPAERGIINVTVEGGELVSLGSACPFYELSYLDSKCDTYYGEALAIVRADGGAASLKLSATDGRLSSKAVVEIERCHMHTVNTLIQALKGKCNEQYRGTGSDMG